MDILKVSLCTRDRYKKVVRCITNVSEAVVHLRYHGPLMIYVLG